MVQAIQQEIEEISTAMTVALEDGQLDVAQTYWLILRGIEQTPPQTLAIGAFIAIARGQFTDALQYLETLPEETCPDLKALCYYAMKDPIWHAHAQALEDNVDPLIRAAMNDLRQAAPAA